MVISSALLASSVGSLPLNTPAPALEAPHDRRRLSRPFSPKPSNKRSHALAFSSKPSLANLQRNMIVPIPKSQWILPVIAASSMASHRLTVVIAATAWILKAIYNPEADSLPSPNSPFINVRAGSFQLFFGSLILLVSNLTDSYLPRRLDRCERLLGCCYREIYVCA